MSAQAEEEAEEEADVFFGNTSFYVLTNICRRNNEFLCLLEGK